MCTIFVAMFCYCIIIITEYLHLPALSKNQEEDEKEEEEREEKLLNGLAEIPSY